MKFSIILPVYNVEKYIEKCLESILSQTYKNYEIIIVDDGSTDDSIIIAEKITKNKQNVKIVKKENGGLSDARNFGLNYVTGDYIWFIDSDDYIRNDALEILNNNSKYDIICFGYYKVINNKIIQVNIGNEDLDNVSRYLINTPSACMRVYSRKLLLKNKLHFEKGKYYEDLGFTPTLVKYTKKIGFVDDYLYYYQIRNNSIMTTASFNEKKDDRFWAINNIIKCLNNNYNDEVEYLAIKHLIIMYSIDILKCNKDIYLPRINKTKAFLKIHFPKYSCNKYLKRENIFKRIYVYCYKLGFINICKLLIKIGGY